MDYIVTWTEFYKGVKKLYRQVRWNRKKYRKILAIGRGGVTLGNVMGWLLRLPVEVQVVSNYRYRNRIRHDSIVCEDSDVLVIDDIIDTGVTTKRVKSDIMVFVKKRDVPSLKYYAIEIKQNQWVSFPWEKE